jgi:hypothetical protein
MDEEQIRIDIAEAIGKATAAICLQGAFVGALIAKEIISAEDAATVTGIANEGLGLSPAVREMAEAAIRGFAKSWTKRITRN